jgi:hypothetical protein
MDREEINARIAEIKQALAVAPIWMAFDPEIEKLGDELNYLEGLVTSEEEERWMAPKMKD